MHNLHFLLINADFAKDAAAKAESLILHWGDENNGRTVGGVASEDGSDDIENHRDGGWGLSFLDDEEGIPRDGTPFRRAVAFLHREITTCDPLYSTHADPGAAVRDLGDRLRTFDPEAGNTFDLSSLVRDLGHLSEMIDSRRALGRGREIPSFYDWQLDEFGLTDLTKGTDGARRYLVFLDMHS